MRPSTKYINELLEAGKYEEIVSLYSGYIDKYVRILRGEIPDNSLDTRLFLESDVSNFDIESLLRIYQHINEIDSLDVALTTLLRYSIKEAKNAWDINFRFRSKVYRWMQKLSKMVYDEEI